MGTGGGTRRGVGGAAGSEPTLRCPSSPRVPGALQDWGRTFGGSPGPQFPPRQQQMPNSIALLKSGQRSPAAHGALLILPGREAPGQPHTSSHPRPAWSEGRRDGEGWRGLEKPINPLLPGGRSRDAGLPRAAESVLWNLGNEASPTPPHTWNLPPAPDGAEKPRRDTAVEVDSFWTGMSPAPLVPHGCCPALPRGRSSSGTSENHIKLIGSQFSANKEKAGDIYLAE